MTTYEIFKNTRFKRTIERKEAAEENSERKICIIGTVLETAIQCPYDDPTFEVWTLSNMFHLIPHDLISKYFEIHDMKEVVEHEDSVNWLAFMKENQDKCYINSKSDLLPNANVLDIDELIASNGFYRDYFTSTVAYMIAYAISIDVKEIHLYGVHVCMDSEYSYERPSIEYWIGQAEARGITIYIPDEAELLKATHRYGYEKAPVLMKCIGAKKKELEEKELLHKQNTKGHEAASAFYKGQIELLSKLISQVSSPGEMQKLVKEKDDVSAKLFDSERNVMATRTQEVYYKGALDTLKWLITNFGHGYR